MARLSSEEKVPKLDTKYTWMLSEQWLLKAKNQAARITFNYPVYFS